MIKNVLFDLDGTLIDSSECIYTVYSALLEELGVPMPVGQAKRRLIGPPVESTLRRFGVDNPVESGKRFREIYNDVDLKKTNKLYDGVREMLASLLNAGYRLFVATSKSEFFADRILGLLDAREYFTAIYGSRYELGRTEKSEVLESLISDFSLNKSECILIGDTVFDVEGAEKVDLRVAIVSYGFGEAKDFDGRKIEFFAAAPQDVTKEISRYDNG